jgi:hypothetical protein
MPPRTMFRANSHCFSGTGATASRSGGIENALAFAEECAALACVAVVKEFILTESPRPTAAEAEAAGVSSDGGYTGAGQPDVSKRRLLYDDGVDAIVS